MRLVKPNKKYANSWYNALKEFNAENADGFWNIPFPPKDFEEYQQRCSDHSKGKNLPANWVQASTFWLIDNDKFIGHTNIRHELTKKLKNYGGNIGYYIRPSERKKGYGTKILELALKKAKKIGLNKVLITCSDNNIASQKIIEKNGGKLRNKVETKDGLIRRYYINL
jgi:predicted acetyltransferase